MTMGIGIGLPWMTNLRGAILRANFRASALGLGGVAALPGGWVLTRSSIGSITTSASTIVRDIPVDYARIGPNGLYVERGTTNLWLWSEDLANTAPVNATVNAGGAGDKITDPAGGTLGEKIVLNGGGLAAIYRSRTWNVAKHAFTMWNKCTSGSPQHNVRAPGVAGVGVNQYSATLIESASAWRKNEFLFNLTTSGGASTILDEANEATHATGPSTYYGAFYQLEENPYPTEYIKTVGASASCSADILTRSTAGLIQSGRLGIELIIKPHGSIGGSYDYSSDRNVIYGSANDSIRANYTTGVLTIRVAGVDYVTAIGKTYERNAVNELRYWVESGGGSLQSVAKTWADGTVTTLGTSGAPQGNWTASSIQALGNGASEILGADIAEIRVLPAGRRPSWA